MANTKDYSMREMIIDQCLSTGREFTREELQEAVNKGLQSRDMLPIKSKVTILQDINHPYMRLHVDKWRENGASTREIVLMEFLRKFLI
jgi:hypothetical protein